MLRPIVVCTAIFILSLSTRVWASGMTLHIWISELAAQKYVYTYELQQVLREQEAAYKSGSIFPDSGYAINHLYGEYAHWHKFLNAYYAVVEQQCPTLETEDCRRLFAHFLGTLAHDLTDVNFDRHFLTEVGDHDHGGDWDKAQTFTDPGCDFLSILEHQRGFKIPDLKLPENQLIAAFNLGNEVAVSIADIQKGTNLQKLALIGEPLGSPFTYFYYKQNMAWGSTHYVDARGGVIDSAQRIAEAWELVWQHYNRHEIGKELFNSAGQWPLMDFYVAGQLLEDF